VYNGGMTYECNTTYSFKGILPDNIIIDGCSPYFDCGDMGMKIEYTKIDTGDKGFITVPFNSKKHVAIRTEGIFSTSLYHAEEVAG